MKLLAIETSSSYLSIAIQSGDTFLHSHENVGQKHAELCLPTIHSLLNEAQMKASELDGIVVSVGPGSFTGLRIGCGIAQGLALAHRLPVAHFNTLETLAFATGTGICQVVYDARMQEVYYATYENLANGQQREIKAPAVGAMESIPFLNQPEVAICGNGLTLYPEASHLFDQCKSFLQVQVPDARTLLGLAQHNFAQRCHPAEHLDLLYVRDKVALTTQERTNRS